MPSTLAAHWTLDPAINYLNHGSFGACPRVALASQRALQDRLERSPVKFLDRELPDLMRLATARLANFLNADPQDIVPVANATSGVNAVLWSLPLEPGDELLVTDHAYNACRNALDRVAEVSGAVVEVVTLPWPVGNEEEIVARLMERVTARTVLALIDHVTSATALVLPVERLVQELNARGVESLIDGAHVPGMLPLDLRRLGASFYTGNAHKWLCAPKGAAFLYVARDLQSQIRPLVVSHGANKPLSDESQRFLTEFEWTGTHDPTAYLSIPAAIDAMAAMVPGGWPEIMQRNRQLAIDTRRMLLKRWDLPELCPDSMLGSIATVQLADAAPDGRTSFLQPDPWQQCLFDEHQIEVPIFSWPAPPKRMLRISAQLYNAPSDYENLAEAIESLAR